MIINQQDVLKRFNELETLLREKNYDTQHVQLIRNAFVFADNAHYGQKRFTGEPYVIHCIETAFNLVNLDLDYQTIIAGILHDTVEDAGVKLPKLAQIFSKDIAMLVDGVTKVSNIKLRGSSNEIFVENLRKMFVAMSKDLRVVLIKIADRLHNMQTLSGVPEVKRARIAKETLEVYAPLAERLGMGEIKGQLEDLAFYYLFPSEYKELLIKSAEYYKKSGDIFKKMREKILIILKDQNINAQIQTRKKHLYSLWRKLQRREIDGDFSKIHDIIAFRIIVKDTSQCYLVLGLIHKLYKPVPHLGISDYIAQPKPSGYQSIHTKVFGENGKIIEIQIRSEEMHKEAEFGIASHWVYSEAKTRGASDETLKRGILNNKTKLDWVKQLISWQSEIKNTDEYLNALKFDALSHRIFVFSPKGDVYDLPIGATPLDFAYAVHTKLVDYLIGAKVNGKTETLNYSLNNGDMVEIITSKNKRNPSDSWINMVKTTSAKKEIKKRLRKIA